MSLSAVTVIPKIVADHRMLSREKLYKLTVSEDGVKAIVAQPLSYNDAWFEISTPVVLAATPNYISLVYSPQGLASPHQIDGEYFEYTNCPGQFYFSPYIQRTAKAGLRDVTEFTLKVFADDVPVRAHIIVRSPCVFVFN